MTATGFLSRPELSTEVQHLLDADVAEVGHPMNASWLWAHDPDAHDRLFGLLTGTATALGLDVRQRGILITACASTLGDSYCSLAWGTKLAGASDEATAGAVLRGTDEGLSGRERAMAGWARAVARDPNRTTPQDVQALRDVGFTDAEIFALTVFVALRLAFSTVNDALGVPPDAQYRTAAPRAVLEAVTFGRPTEPWPADTVPE